MRDLKRETKSPPEIKKPSNKFFRFLRSDPMVQSPGSDESPRTSTNSGTASPGYYSDRSNYQMSVENSPYMSPWNAAASPFVKSPWTLSASAVAPLSDEPSTGLVGSLTREAGHLYSLAASGDLLYTGSDSKNIRVWKNRAEYSGFKSSSGLVKAIVISGDRIFTGHQDGKIRIWRVSPKDPSVHKRVGSLPRLKDFLKSSINPSNYVEVRRHRNTVWIRHFDAVSCLSLDEQAGLLYSGSWDKTLKVWRVADSKCLESVNAHDDAINSVAVGFDGLVFAGSADGTVKVWKREVVNGKNGYYSTTHVLLKTLLRQECAVTALAVSHDAGVVYCGTSDGAVNFWEKGRRLAHGGALRGHKMAVLCLATAGSLVISGSADRTIRVWRRDAGGAHDRMAVLTGHAGPIKCLAVEEEREYGGPDGPRWVLYSGSLDKSVKIWRVAERGKVSHVTRKPQHVMGEFEPRLYK